MNSSISIVIIIGAVFITGIFCMIMSLIYDEDIILYKTKLSKPINYYPQSSTSFLSNRSFDLEDLIEDDEDASVNLDDSPT